MKNKAVFLILFIFPIIEKVEFNFHLIRSNETGYFLLKFVDLMSLSSRNIIEAGDGGAGAPEFADDKEKCAAESFIFVGAADNIFLHSHT